jgi:hypothetical protein
MQTGTATLENNFAYLFHLIEMKLHTQKTLIAALFIITSKLETIQIFLN